MNTIAELRDKAAKASLQYRTLYGSFPSKIGIHILRIEFLGWLNPLIFPDVTPFNYLEDITAESIKNHEIKFVEVDGPYIDWNEVYLPAYQDEKHIISGEEISLLLYHKERKEHYEARQKRYEVDGLVILDEREEEVDCCPGCYGRYLSFRKLHDIYDPWFAPKCYYCEQKAKYHVHRSDWLWNNIPMKVIAAPLEPTAEKEL